MRDGANDGTRTRDVQNHNLALYRLSYVRRVNAQYSTKAARSPAIEFWMLAAGCAPAYPVRLGGGMGGGENQKQRDGAQNDEGERMARPTVRLGTRGWYHGGRWLAHRERCGIADEVPLPPFHEARPVSAGVDRVLGRLGLQSANLQAILIDEWPALVGEDVARHTRPGAIRGRELTVFVRGAVWFAELKRIGVTTMQGRIARRVGDDRINRVVLRPDPQGGTPA